MAFRNMGFGEREGKITFTTEQLIEIYEHTGRNPKIEALRKAASELYPDIVVDGKPPLILHNGDGRAVARTGRLQNAVWEKPAHILHSNACLPLVILSDGEYVVG